MTDKWRIFKTSAEHHVANGKKKLPSPINAKFKTDKRNAEVTDDSVFSLMWVMLISEKILQTSIIFLHLVKSIDNHCYVSDIVNEVQHYFDRGHKTDTTTTLDSNVMCAHKSQRTDKPNRHPNDSDQVLRISKHLSKPNTRDSRPNQSESETDTQTCQSNLSAEIAWRIAHDSRVAHLHRSSVQTHVATADTNTRKIPPPPAQNARGTKMAKTSAAIALMSFVSYYDRVMCSAQTSPFLCVCRILNQDPTPTSVWRAHFYWCGHVLLLGVWWYICYHYTPLIGWTSNWFVRNWHSEEAWYCKFEIILSLLVTATKFL